MSNDLILKGESSNRRILMMSSKEIAELTGKEHFHVLRDIRTMLSKNQEDPNLDLADGDAIQGVIVELDESTGRTREIWLDQLHALDLIAGYDWAARHRINERLLRLEAEAKFAAGALPPTTELADLPIKRGSSSYGRSAVRSTMLHAKREREVTLGDVQITCALDARVTIPCNGEFREFRISTLIAIAAFGHRPEISASSAKRELREFGIFVIDDEILWPRSHDGLFTHVVREGGWKKNIDTARGARKLKYKRQEYIAIPIPLRVYAEAI